MDEIAHTQLYFGEIVIDIFSSESYEYLSPPDFDVNMLCWTGSEYTIWYPVREGDEELHGYHFDIDSIIQRVMSKEAVAMIGEWREGDESEIIERYNKLVSKGWLILNDTEVRNFLGV